MKGPLRTALSVVAYPAVMAGNLGAALVGLRAGVSPALLVVALTGSAALAAFLLERLLPYRAAWGRSRGDVTVDLVFNLLSAGSAELARPLAAFLCGALAHRLALSLGASPWPTRWPLLAQLPLALVLGELGVYWVHRIQHGGGLLWRLHAIHHSVPRMYWLNNGRNHPLDVLLSVTLLLLPLTLLGAGADVLALVSIFSTTHSFFQHSNIDLRLGPLNWILSAAEVHRFHHSRVLAESNANYGQNLLVWDLCFGTRRVPRDRPPPEDVGLHGAAPFPTGILGQLAAPFEPELFRDSTDER